MPRGTVEKMQVEIKGVLGSATVFMQGGSFRLVLPRRAARILGIKSDEDVDPDEFTFILLETNKGIMLRPVRDYIADHDELRPD